MILSNRRRNIPPLILDESSKKTNPLTGTFSTNRTNTKRLSRSLRHSPGIPCVWLSCNLIAGRSNSMGPHHEQLETRQADLLDIDTLTAAHAIRCPRRTVDAFDQTIQILRKEQALA